MSRLSASVGMVGGLAGAVLLLVSASGPAFSGEGVIDKQRVLDALLRDERERLLNIETYSRLQHYMAMTERFGSRAEMLVRMHYDRHKGKHYEILSRSGSAYIQSKIFDKLLHAEVDSTAEYLKDGSLLSPRYYAFELLGQQKFGGRACYLLELKPLRKDKRLVNGKAWVDAHDYGLVHTEGRLSASISFWVGKPTIAEDFQRVGKYWLALRRHSTADTFLLGKSELTIDYSEYQVVDNSTRE